MPPTKEEGVDEIIDDAAAKAAADKEASDAKAKADEAAKADAAAKSKSEEPAKTDRKLDDLIKDPKIREQIKSIRGWTDSQLDSSYQMAPMQEKMARMETREKYKDFEEHKEFIDKELANVAIFDRTPQVMERLYWMAKGKNAIENPKKENSERKRDVVGERIHSPYPSSSSGSSSGGGGKESTLTEEQKQYAAFLGVPEEAYEKAKKGYDPVDKRRIRPPEPYKPPQGGNSADHALGVLLKGRR